MGTVHPYLRGVIFSTPSGSASAQAVHPHMRGANAFGAGNDLHIRWFIPTFVGLMAFCQMIFAWSFDSSPLRGVNRVHALRVAHDHRFIPTQAGECTVQSRRGRSGAVHPHYDGANNSSIAANFDGNTRPIPTCVGLMASAKCSVQSTTVHPHGYGANDSRY